MVLGKPVNPKCGNRHDNTVVLMIATEEQRANLNRLIMFDNLRIDLFLGTLAAVRGKNVWWENQ